MGCTARMKRCIAKVKAKGHSKKSAGNICAISVLKKRLKKKRRKK